MSEHTLTAGDPAQPPSREHKPEHEAGAIPHAPAAASTRSGWTLPCLERHPHRHGYVGDDALTARVAKARATFAWKQLMRCFPKYGRLSDALDRQAIEQLADNQPTDPNHPETWRSVYQHAAAHPPGRHAAPSPPGRAAGPL